MCYAGALMKKALLTTQLRMYANEHESKRSQLTQAGRRVAALASPNSGPMVFLNLLAGVDGIQCLAMFHTSSSFGISKRNLSRGDVGVSQAVEFEGRPDIRRLMFNRKTQTSLRKT